jgi:outer membrane protein OmpA-like peptidoglycan-associated protein
MRQLVFFLAALLVFWIAGSSWWYVCRIRCDCKATAEVPAVVQDTSAVLAQTAEQALLAAVGEAKTYLAGAGIQKGFFESSSALGDMSSVSDEYIKNLKLVLENNPSARLEVTGHTDSTGSDWFNDALGLKRAEFVRTYLVNAGINADQIVTASKGSREPAASNSTREGRAANRRTEIKVII